MVVNQQLCSYCSVQPVCVCAVVLCSPDERRFCVFSLAASTDGKEILGGWVQFAFMFQGSDWQGWNEYWRLFMKFEFKHNSAFLPFVGGIFEICLLEPQFRGVVLFFSQPLFSHFRANDGCLYVFDLEQNKRMLKVSVSLCAFMSFCSRVALAVPVSASRLSDLRFILRSRLARCSGAETT